TGTIAPAGVMAMPIVDAEGNVRVESNAFDLSTGELQNETGIQLPAGLLDQPIENVSQPTRPGLAPSSVNLEINETISKSS
ncbi:MAG: hypothetical protein AAFW95_09940, partial [Cyanobacteria bacterium J06638_6]